MERRDRRRERTIVGCTKKHRRGEARLADAEILTANQPIHESQSGHKSAKRPRGDSCRPLDGIGVGLWVE